MDPSPLPDAILSAPAAWAWLQEPARLWYTRKERARMPIEHQTLVQTLLAVCADHAPWSSKIGFSIITSSDPEDRFRAQLIPEIQGWPPEARHCVQCVRSHLARWDDYGLEELFGRIQRETIPSLGTPEGLARVLGEGYGAHLAASQLDACTPEAPLAAADIQRL